MPSSVPPRHPTSPPPSCRRWPTGSGPAARTACWARTVLTSSPRLLSVIHERFEQIAEQIVELVLEREGPDFGPVRARLAVGVLVAVFDSAMEAFAQGQPDDPELADLVIDHLALVGELFGARTT